MIYNIHFGQARPTQFVDGTPVKMQHRHVTPKKMVGAHRADSLGNIEVTDPEDIIDMGPPVIIDGISRGLGYPRYVGDGTGPVQREDLEFFMEPLKPDKYRSLTEAEWAVHQEAVYQSYIQAASQDAKTGRLDGPHLDRYIDTIERVYGRSLTDLEARPFRDLVEG
ncbi:MAG TPA: hypothetical protein VFR55_04260 [Dehalococcoidia bacterium]|nr:hypothetical protein [Dehalococcoidia bacterium]